MKRERKSGFEQDAFSTFGRRYLCYIQRPGVRAKAKNISNRRIRREGSIEAERDDPRS
jgi:hypothetical protein